MASAVQKWGNSLGIRIPKGVAEQVRLLTGTVIEFDTTGGILTIRPKRARKHTLKKLLAGVKTQTPYKELGDEGPVGGERL